MIKKPYSCPKPDSAFRPNINFEKKKRKRKKKKKKKEENIIYGQVTFLLPWPMYLLHQNLTCVGYYIPILTISILW
jgi:hypothetical protein